MKLKVKTAWIKKQVPGLGTVFATELDGLDVQTETMATRLRAASASAMLPAGKISVKKF